MNFSTSTAGIAHFKNFCIPAAYTFIAAISSHHFWSLLLKDNSASTQTSLVNHLAFFTFSKMLLDSVAGLTTSVTDLFCKRGEVNAHYLSSDAALKISLGICSTMMAASTVIAIRC